MKKQRRKKAIETMLAENLPVAEIVQKTKASRSLIYKMKAEAAEARASVVLRKDLPWTTLQSGDLYGNKNPEVEMQKVECVICGRPMWTATLREDMCEECTFGMMQDAAKAQQQRDVPRNVNPFGPSMAAGMPLDIPGDTDQLFS